MCAKQLAILSGGIHARLGASRLDVSKRKTLHPVDVVVKKWYQSHLDGFA
jgi:hypothetical protein